MQKVSPDEIDKMMENVNTHVDRLRDQGLEPYTVIGYYDDEGKGFFDHIMAADWNDTVVQWCKLREPTCDDAEARKYWRDNITIVDVVKGHAESVYDCGHICCASDWPGLQEGKEIG